MDTERRMELIMGIGEEVITCEELRHILETKQHPVAYDGFELSGLAHLPFGIYRPLLLKDLIKAGIHFKLWLADWFAWINNKMGGDLEKIHKVGEYFIEVWKAAGVNTKKVEFLWASEHMDREYWKRFILIGKNTTVNRAARALTIMGRKEGELAEVSQYFYPIMQANDIFQLKADITQLGVDQRRANILAREVGPKLGLWKPVVVSHHMLIGLEGVKKPEGFEENKELDKEISSKMSKSKPGTCIYVHDTRHEIEKKVAHAFCLPKIIEDNPMLEYSKYILFKKFGKMKIVRPQKFGGTVVFDSYDRLETAYRKGELHPADLKNAVAEGLDAVICPIRKHFEKGNAKKLYDFVKKQEITR